MKTQDTSGHHIPMTRKEMDALGWESIDILLVTGDAYVDHHSFGIAIIGRVLLSKGYRVGIVSQPDWRTPESLKRLGPPRVACAVTSGNIDSMLCIYTAGRRKRVEDAYSPGGRPGLRPPHAAVVYSQLARQAFPGVPVILGGVEASMRRFAHYDYWQDKIRPGILADSRADILIYGMGEKAILDVIGRIVSDKPLDGIRGTVRYPGARESSRFIDGDAGMVRLPSYEEVLASRDALMEETISLEGETNPYCARKVFQRHGDRAIIQEPPCLPPSTEELDAIYDLPFTGLPHPSYKEKIPAFEVVRNSIASLRGCPGGCSFCGISSHQGKFIASRSIDSILREIRRLASREGFRGTVSDIGGPTANTYGHSQAGGEACRNCRRPSCLFPAICKSYRIDQLPLVRLLDAVSGAAGVKNVFISSGIRLDLAMRQREQSARIIRNNVSGHLKVAPEHIDDKILQLMRKNGSKDFLDFLDFFRAESAKSGKEQFVTPYFMSNFPGASEDSARIMEGFLSSRKWSLRQVQDFIPLPLTLAGAMYCCGKDCKGRPITVNRGLKERRQQIKSLKKRR